MLYLKTVLQKKNYYLIYTMSFLLLCLFIFGYFFFNNKTFIWSADGWTQHFKALVYYSNWLRSVLYSIVVQHRFELPTYSLGLGYGSDLFTTLHYYAIGDPLNLLSVFVPTRFMAYLYEGLVLLRLYLAGLAFSFFCFYLKKDGNKHAVLSGAFIYIFCAYVLIAFRHPFFLNPLIYFPLLLLGVEKIFRNEKPWLFIGAVSVSACSNFYFFYMLTLMVLLYIVLRLIHQKISPIMGLKVFFKISLFSIIGVLISSFIFLPVVLLFLTDPRSGVKHTYDFLYPISYYRSFLGSFLTNKSPGFWTLMGYGGISGLSVIVLMMQKNKNVLLKYFFIILTLFLLLPIFGRIMNGFSYIANRWEWAYSMLVSYIVVESWENLKYYFTNKWKSLLVISVIFVATNLLLEKSFTKPLIFQNFLILIAFLIVYLWKRINIPVKLDVLLVLVTCLGLMGNAYFAYSKSEGNYIKDFRNSLYKINSELWSNEAHELQKLNSRDSFYRFSGDVLTSNANMLEGVSSTQYFWSLSNSKIKDFLKKISIRETIAYNSKTLDERVILNSLVGVKYFVATNKNIVPHDFTILKKKFLGGRSLYKNPNALPFGYTYNHFMPSSKFEKLNAIQAQELMLQNVVLDSPLQGFKEGKASYDYQTIPFNAAFDKRFVSVKNKTFIVAKKNAEISLNFSGIKESETYLYLQGLGFKALPDEKRAEQLEITVDFEKGGDKKTTKKIYYSTPKHSFYCGRHDFVVNSSFSKRPITTIKIRFSHPGQYSFSSLKVICQPMKMYKKYLAQRKEEILIDVNLHLDKKSFATNHISGKITNKASKILLINLPYSKGWSAYVDGKKETLLPANVMFMALPLRPGSHDIQLYYHTPGLKLGFGLSVVGIILVTILYLHYHKKHITLES